MRRRIVFGTGTRHFSDIRTGSDPWENAVTDTPMPVPCHCLAVRQAARQVTQLYDRHLAPVGLRATQFAVLMAIHRNAPLAMHALARRLVMDRTALSRALRPLERDGLVQIGCGPDARTRALRLTEPGEARLAAARPLWRAAQQDFEGQFGAADAEALRLSLARVVGRTSRGEHSVQRAGGSL